MPFDLFYGVAVLMAILIFILLLVFYLPVRKIGTDVRRSRENLIREYKLQENYTFFLNEDYKLFSGKTLKNQWRRYIDSINRNKGHSEYSNIREYFSPDRMLDETTNTPLATFVPAIVFSAGLVLTATAVVYYRAAVLLTEYKAIEASYTVLALAFVSLCMSGYYKHLTYRTKEQLRSFCQWIEQGHGAISSLTEELADLRMSMHHYQHEQLMFYADLNNHIASTTRKAVKPYLEDVRTAVADFVQAATSRQIESMKRLAEYFARDTTKLYLDQIEKISGTTAGMAEIQAKTAETLQSVTTIYTESRECIDRVGNTTGAALSQYNESIAQMTSLQAAMVDSVKELQDLAEYIRTNSKNQNFTIENLSKYQNELIETSERSTASLQQFFREFNDQYLSSIIALRAASGDMMQAGEFIRSSYTGFTGNLNQDIDAIFKTFEENLATISLHLSRSIRDLQEAIDELPAILRQSAPEKTGMDQDG